MSLASHVIFKEESW